MSWIKINSEKDLPEEGKYVLVKHTRGTWHDGRDQENVNCVVAILEKGLSENDRQKMKDGTLPDEQTRPPEDHGSYKLSGLRSDTYRSCDEHGNNQVPYYWDTFGPDSFFGQDISHWMPIPSV